MVVFCMRRAERYISAVVLAAFLVANDARAYYVFGQLSPENFNKMYALASHGEVASLREAIGRGLYIDSLNSEGDTGLCVAVKRGNRVAYNSFRMSGANPHHACTYRMYDEYRRFLASNQVASTRKVVGDAASLYYEEEGRSWWPWILGGALVGGGIWALSKKSGGSSKHHSGSGNSGSGSGDDPVLPETLGYGLAHYLDNYTKLVKNNVENSNIIDGRNPNAEKVVDSIKFLPNMLDNYKYLKTYVKVVDGGSFHNLSGGNIQLGDASVGLASHGDGSTIMNDGSIDIEGRNGAIGMVASNGSQAINGADTGVSGDQSSDGSIRFIFKGSQEGDAAIGMYADTRASIINYGKIYGIASQAEASNGDNSSSSGSDVGDLVDDLAGEDLTQPQAANSGTMIGMSLFDFYTGTDFSNSTITAKNYGNIILQAGNNNASDVSISLIGMGSYLDDKFLNGKNNPAFAENMLLQNYGNINLSYQKVYNLSSDALKLGTGGLIGMRADASTGALNQGNINIDMQATNISSGSDVAAGMLSVHGAGLVNGTAGMAYDGEGSDTGGTIRVINEATSGGVFYGMLAAKGSGSQTSLYKWQKPYLRNYGLIDMQSSNSYAMASFAGGEMINDGVINLGVENGQSYYTNNKGMYAAGEDITEEVSLINNGIINVYAEQSAAIYNVFSGSVTQTNTGYIYVSNKATNSKVFGGNYSTARNIGSILYKVGNSHTFAAPEGSIDDVGFNVEVDPAVSVVTASGEGSSTKQYAVNDETGIMTIGGSRDKDVDYGGTFGTVGMQVSKQGSADNKGVISLEKFDQDISQFNVGMWLDSTATAEAYINNYGNIVVNAGNSIGMRNDSVASATNFSTIDVLGRYGYGMSVTATGGNIFNGRYLGDATENKTINVVGSGSVGMYVKGKGNVYNYGLINLLGDNTTAFQLDGEGSKILVDGDIEHLSGLNGVTYFWMVNGASREFDYPDGITIEGYTLGKATQGGKAYFSRASTAYVSDSNSHLFVAKDSGSAVYNYGKIEVSNGARAILAEAGASAYNDLRDAKITIKDDDSIGIFGDGEGTTVGSTPGSNIYVEAGKGIYAQNLAKIESGGNISVTDGVGLYLTDGGSEKYTQGTNTGTIDATGIDSTGVKVINGAQFSNKGIISATEGAQGIYTNHVVTNENGGKIFVSDESVGIYNVGNYKNVTNSGDISVSGASAYGIYGGGVNQGEIEVEDGTGIKGRAGNSGRIVVISGIGVDGSTDNSGTIEVRNGTGVNGTLENTGTISVTGVGLGAYGSGSNSGVISISGGTGVRSFGAFVNSGEISGRGTGVEVMSGSFTNQGNISIANGTGIEVDGGSTAHNAGYIDISDGNGFYVKSSGLGSNSGVINVANTGYGAYVESGGAFSNIGTINYSSSKGGHCSNISVGGECVDSDAEEGPTGISSVIQVEDGGKFINNGNVNLDDIDVDFNEGGEYVLADGGTYRASSFKGNVTAGSDIVMDGFKDVYTEQNAFEGKNEGLSIKSDSYMFDARLEDGEGATDVYMDRKDFKDIVNKEDLAAFLEDNYHQHGNEKMYRALKSASNEVEFDAQTESESGQRFYANLPKENMVVLRQLSGQTQKRALEDGVEGVGVGADYYRTGKDGVDRLSGYDDNVYSVYANAGGKLNRYWSVGGSLMAAYDDSQYSDIHSKRDNKIFMALLPIMYHNNQFKWVMTPEFGVGYGSYVRKTLNNKYEADTFDIYYGVYNAAEYSIDMKVAELVTEAELNLQAIDSDKVKEKGGFYLNNHNTTSLEAGIGLKLRKRIQLAKERELILALGSKYYHEFLDPYEDLTIGSGATSKTYRLKGYSENKNRLKTTAEATYKDGPLAISAEISHNAEKESNVEGDIGLRYHF